MRTGSGAKNLIFYNSSTISQVEKVSNLLTASLAPALFFPCNLQVQALAEADLQDACEIRLNRRRELAHVPPSSRRES